MAGPHSEFGRDLMKEARFAMHFGSAVAGHVHVSVSELPIARAPHLAAKRARHQLHPVADAENRNSQVEEVGIAHGCAFVRHAAWPPRQNETDRVLALQL